MNENYSSLLHILISNVLNVLECLFSIQQTPVDSNSPVYSGEKS